MTYQMIGWVLKNGERHLLKGDPVHHPGLEGEIMKYHPENTPGGLPPGDCCCICCCNYEECVAGGTVESPDTLTATLVRTGDCSCLPASVTLTETAEPLGCDWNSPTTLECGGETFKITLSCSGGSPPNCPWNIDFVCKLPTAIQEWEEISCNPLYIRSVPFTPVGGCCTGTVQVIITE